VSNLFKPLPVRRKEFERNAKREFGKALGILTAYALVPCLGSSKHPNAEPNTVEKNGIRFMVSNQLEGG
jgi:DNA mismatch repair protein PMS2